MALRPSDHPEYRALVVHEQATLRGDPEVTRRRARPTLAPTDDIATILNALSSHLQTRGVPRGLLHLGGGSVLAAAWSHRTSTDIDLWVSPERAPQLLALAPDAESWVTLFSPPGHRAIVDTASSRIHGSLIMTLDDVPVSLFTSHFADRTTTNRQVIRGSIFAVATTEEILSGKLLGRWTDQLDRAIPIRDLYDVTVARAVEPRALRRVLRSMPEAARTKASERLLSLPEDWHLRDPKRILDPVFDVTLPGLARRLAQPIRNGDWQRIPAPQRTDFTATLQHNQGLDR